MASTCCAPTASCPPSRWRYREPWKVEQIFRTTKAVLEMRPVHHAGDAAIRGHLFTSFLALVLRKELQDRLQAVELDLEWQDVIADLDRVVETSRPAGTSLRAAQSGARLCRSSDPGRWCRPAAPVPTLATARCRRRGDRTSGHKTSQAPPHTPYA